MRLSFFLLIVSSISGRLAAQTMSPADVRKAVREYRLAHEGAIVRQLVDLLAIPNNAADDIRIRQNAATLQDLLRARGFSARLLESPGSPPVVFAEQQTPGASRTIVFYAHYDGQPVDSTQWSSNPYQAVLRSQALFAGGTEIPLPGPTERVDPESRLYGRSASDDKSPIVALLTALDALKAQRIPLSVNLKVFLEGEEEAGSGHLRQMLETHRDRLTSDGWIFADGPVHQSRRPQIVFGVRGVMGLGLSVFGPTRPLHSGHYGNFAPNPNVLLVHLLASMRDPEGVITIDGFYDDITPLTAADRRAFASIPSVDDELRAALGIGQTEANNAPLAERLTLPALNLDGLDGGPARAGAANVIQPVAYAAIDFRLVPGQQPDRVRALVEAHIRKQGFTIVSTPPDSLTRATNTRLVRVTWGTGYPAVRTPLDLPIARAITRIATATLGEPAIEVPTLGGSLPLFHFAEVLGVPLIVVPMVNHDNNQHGADENLRIQNLWDGIELYAGLLAGLGHEMGLPVP